MDQKRHPRLSSGLKNPTDQLIAFRHSGLVLGREAVGHGTGVAFVQIERGGLMSSKGVYTALSGAIAQSQKLDTIANNIANVNTAGFKKDQQVFREYLTAYEKPSDVIQVPKVPASIESFY